MIPADELARLHAAVESACAEGTAGALPVLGYGEISLVAAWPPEAPQWAVKRLPVFPGYAAVARYSATLDRYVTALRGRGVDVLETALKVVESEHDHLTAYLVQPVVPTDALMTRLLALRDPDPRDPLLTHVVDRIPAVVDERVGLDAHVANWAVLDDRIVYFDLTTPLLRDAAGAWEVDGRLLAAAVPWALRPPLTRFVIPSIVARYHDPRTVLLDVAVNLLRVRLSQWLPALLEAGRERTGIALTEAEVRRDYRSESRTWSALQAVRRGDRAWQRHVRHRPYPFLIPDRTGW